ncbi:MAG: polyhydroxyalkanoic acid system family protein [Moraxellaceae bacterium]|nr:polyhydroxyalkanoic acid system family protein [Moraxellaceae bacterium]
MADIELEKEHNFDFETAREKAQTWLEKAKEEMGLNIEYTQGETEDVASIKQSGVDARVFLDAEKLRFEADLNFIAKPLKGMISTKVQEGMDKYLA